MRKVLLLLLTIAILTGCNQNNDQNHKISQLQENMTLLQSEIESLRAGIIPPQITKSEPNLFNSYSLFTADSTGYRAVRTEIGYFVVGLHEVKPYENGYKLIFNIGNPSALTYEGVKATILWGEAPKPSESTEDWIKSLKTSQQLESSKLILPGKWNQITFTLSPASPKDTEMVLFALHVNRVDFSSGMNAENKE